jgi:hypothetical protein
MRAIAAVLVLALGAVGLVAPAGAGNRLKRLGEDPANDAPPALDITYLDVGIGGLLDDGKAQKGLEIRIGVANMLPEIGGYPELPGIEWVFKVGRRTFVAEGVAGRTPRFFLFEYKGGAFQQLDDPAGTYRAEDGFIRMIVPLKTIGAKRGTVITGTDATGAGGDVDAHVHHAGTTYADVMETTKPFVVP